MIIVSIAWGLGNQLFDYAVGRCLAHIHNTELKIAPEYPEGAEYSWISTYKLNNFNIQENFATEEELKSLPRYRQPDNIFDAPDNIHLSSCKWVERSFIYAEDIIRREFTLKNPLHKVSNFWKEKILSCGCSVSMHVRHGDFLTYESRNLRGLAPVSYYQTALNELRKDFPDVTVFVFSDDLEWCKENLKFDVPTEFVEGCEYDFEELYLMSLCTHNVLGAATTFSWWGAWLNKNPDKKVFVPDPGIRNFEAFPPSDPERDIPKNWIRIPIDYTAWEPAFSIIICVENNSPLLSLSLNSVLAQNFKDYEVIIVDASTDVNSQKLCHQTASNEKVTILKADTPANKFAAWNKGLSVARGDYVLFLTDKDFIFPMAVRIAGAVCDIPLKKAATKRETYMTYKNFSNYTPNVVCVVQSLSEDENGTAHVTGIDDKKFLLKSDEPFQNVDTIAELNLSAEEKLIGLATKRISNFVSTKFFKRKFLAENKITFKEKAGGGTDAELLFLVETFLATDKITFVPQVFGGRLK